MKIKTLLIIALVCFAIIPMFIVSYFVTDNIAKDEEKRLTQLLQDTAQNQAGIYGDYLDELTTTTESLANLTYIKTAAASSDFNAEAPANTVLAGHVSADSYLDYAFIVNKSNKLLASSSKDLTDVKITEFLTTNPIVNGKVTAGINKFTGSSNTNIVASAPVGDATLVLLYNTDYFKLIDSYSTFASGSGRVIVIDPSFAVLESGTYSKKLNNDIQGEFIELNNLLQDNLNTQNVAIKTYTYMNTNREAGLTSIGDTGWHVIALADTDKYIQHGGMNVGIVTTLLLCGVIILVLAIFVSLVITKPLTKIQDTLIRIRRGDNEARIDVMSNNEYGEVARSFNNLIDDIVVSESRYRTIIEMSDSIIFEWNFKTNEVFFSNNFNKKFSYRAPSDHYGDSFLLKVKVHPEDVARYRKDLEAMSKGEEFTNNEYRFKNIYGDFIWVIIRTATLRDMNGEAMKVVGAIVDIDRAKKNEQLLTERASFDSLTQLYNRETLENQIANEMQLTAVRKSEMAVLFVDVDDFKIYNDKYSHATGDLVLRFVAHTIKTLVSDFGFAGRFGGDEFVACIRNSEVNMPAKIAHLILQKLEEGFNVEGIEETLSIKASIGISTVKDSALSVEQVIGAADDAMYKVKKTGKANYGIN